MDILYEDNQILVVYKPYGILAQADGSSKKDILTMAKEYIKNKYNKPGLVYLGLVHRLDINTEGIMVLARTSKAASRLSEQIKNNSFNKNYLAIVEGIVDRGVLEDRIEKNQNERKSYVTKNGKLARLYYEKLKSYKINNQDVSLVKIVLETGRFHQIRCQFANIGHPLFGDIKYGSKNLTKHPVLQAYKLTFIHPVKKEKLIFEKIDTQFNFKEVDNL